MSNDAAWLKLLQKSPHINEYPDIVDHSRKVAALVEQACEEMGVHPMVAERARGLAWIHDFGKADWLRSEREGLQDGRDDSALAHESLNAMKSIELAGAAAVINFLPYLAADVLTSCQFISLPFEPKVVYWADLHVHGTERVSLAERREYVFARYFAGKPRESEFSSFWAMREAVVNRFDDMRQTLAELPPVGISSHLRLARFLGGWLYKGEAELLSRLTRESNLLSEPICEVGSWRGRSTVCIAGELECTASRRTLFCVDDWRGGTDADCQRLASRANILGEFLSNVEPYRNRIRTVRGLLRDVVDQLPDRLSMVFLDGDHSLEEVEWESRYFAPRLVPGGLLCFHDLDNPAYPGVRKVVDELLASGVWELVEQVNFLCGLRKRG